jgi:hypothetical protein
VLDENERGVGEAHPAPGALHELHAGLALQQRELLGHGRGRELQRVRDRGDRPARVELAEETEATELKHREERLLNQRHKSESILKR